MTRPSNKKQGRYLCAPLSVLIDDRLSKSERLVLMGLYSFHNYKTDRPVFPSRTSLAKRSDLNNTTRVTELTNSLAQKGWLTKKRKGFTNLIDYRLHVPAYVMWQTFGIELSKLIENTVPIENTVIIKTMTPKVIETMTSKVIETMTSKEHTNLTNQINKPHIGGSDLFDRFWNEYPKKVGRKKTYAIWQSINPSEQDLNAMLINISDRLHQGAWSLETKQFIPHPANYLGGELWTDEIIQRNSYEPIQNRIRPSAADRVRHALQHQSEPIKKKTFSHSRPFLVKDG
jgi:hypothetical protein